MLVKWYKLSVISWIHSRDLTYIMVFTVNNTTVLYSWNLLREQIWSVLTTCTQIVSLWRGKKSQKMFYNDDLFIYLISRQVILKYQKWASTDNGSITIIIHLNLHPLGKKKGFSQLKGEIYSLEHIPVPMQFQIMMFMNNKIFNRTLVSYLLWRLPNHTKKKFIGQIFQSQQCPKELSISCHSY